MVNHVPLESRVMLPNLPEIELQLQKKAHD